MMRHPGLECDEIAVSEGANQPALFENGESLFLHLRSHSLESVGATRSSPDLPYSPFARFGNSEFAWSGDTTDEERESLNHRGCGDGNG